MRFPVYTSEEKVNTKEEGLRCPLIFSPSCMQNEIRIEVYKGARTFGLVLVGGVNNQQTPGDCGIYVSKVLEGGLAEVDRRILPGDRITAIKQYLHDGDAYTFSFDDNSAAKTHEDVKQILRRCKGKVELFIVRKDERSLKMKETLNSISQNVSITSIKGDEAVHRTSGDPYQDTHESDDTNSESSIEDCSKSRLYERNRISFQDNAISDSVSKTISTHTDHSKIQIINLTSLKHSRSWPLSRNSKGCSLDYRDMAKYGIRLNSSLSTDVVQPLNIKVKDHRIKKNWISNKLTSLSIQEDDEEELYGSSLPQVQKRFGLEMEQIVL